VAGERKDRGIPQHGERGKEWDWVTGFTGSKVDSVTCQVKLEAGRNLQYSSSHKIYRPLKITWNMKY